MKIHKTGIFDKETGIQKCSLCGFEVFTIRAKDSVKFKVPDRINKVHNTTTKPIRITSEGWEVGINLKGTPHKLEFTNESANCNRLT